MFLTRPVTDLWDDPGSGPTRHLATALPAPGEAAPLRERLIPRMWIERPRRRRPRRSSVAQKGSSFTLLYIQINGGFLTSVGRLLRRLM